MKNYFKLLGIKSVLGVAASQYLVRHFLLKPFYTNELQINEFYFFVFVLATACLVVAGNLLVAYYEQKIKNLPNVDYNLPVFNVLSMTKVYNLALVLDFVGASLGVLVAWKIGFLNLGFLFIMVATVFYFYALRYKRLLFWGNFCMALLATLPIAFVWLFEFFALRNQPTAFVEFLAGSSLKEITFFVLGYMLLVFFLVYIAQVFNQTIQWLTDKTSCEYSFVSHFGLKNTKLLLVGQILITIALIIVSQVLLSKYHLSKNFLSAGSILFLLPLIFILVKLFSAKEKQDFLVFYYIIQALLVISMLTMVAIQTIL